MSMPVPPSQPVSGRSPARGDHDVGLDLLAVAELTTQRRRRRGNARHPLVQPQLHAVVPHLLGDHLPTVRPPHGSSPVASSRPVRFRAPSPACAGRLAAGESGTDDDHPLAPAQVLAQPPRRLDACSGWMPGLPNGQSDRAGGFVPDAMTRPSYGTFSPVAVKTVRVDRVEIHRPPCPGPATVVGLGFTGTSRLRPGPPSSRRFEPDGRSYGAVRLVTEQMRSPW